jgi:WD40 repeat protein
MLDACMKDYDYESAYRLLTQTTGFCTTVKKDINDTELNFMTNRIIKHTIYSDLRLWERVVLLHKRDRSNGPDRFANPETLESDEYEATVSTLYELLGYGMSANDLAKFASRIATEKFFSSDKEQKIMMLARKLALKCDGIDATRDLILTQNRSIGENIDFASKHRPNDNDETTVHWQEISWLHPSITSRENSGENSGYSPVTSLTSFGSSVVASGSLDGSVFLVHTLNEANLQSRKNLKGLRLEVGKPQHSNSSSSNGDDSIGAISCLAISRGVNHSTRQNAFDIDQNSDNEAILGAIAGCRIIGGTTSGDLNVWSIQDVLTNEFSHDAEDLSSLMSDSYASTQSNHVRSNSNANVKAFRQARKGRYLGGHRGGVTCLSVPDQIYRPDSLISGGNDGLIKHWSLQHSSKLFDKSRRSPMGGRTSRMLFSGRERPSKRLGQEAVNVLAGHGGRILCLETAWHCDRLLSGAADLTMKLWDLSSSGSQCIQTMIGHSGWITNVSFWGRNTALSASTDRSIALWDIRAGSMPLFAIRHHQSPVSDLYIESRNAFSMTSAGADGVVATWDLRKLGYSNSRLEKSVVAATPKPEYTQIFRHPLARMKHSQALVDGAECCGPVTLSKGVSSKYGQGERTVMSVGTDGYINEWDIMSGRIVSKHNTKHNNRISCFTTYNENDNLLKSTRTKRSRHLCTLGGTITAAWDGNIRLRRMSLRKAENA